MNYLHEVNMQLLIDRMESSGQWMRCFNPKDSKFLTMVLEALKKYELGVSVCKTNIEVNSVYMCRSGTAMTYCIVFALRDMESSFACECTVDLMRLDDGGFRHIKTPAMVKLQPVAA